MSSVVDHEHRAGKLWPVLVRTAKMQSPFITYGEAATAIGIHHRPLRYALGSIQDFCLENGYPRLTAVVVSNATRLPGRGFLGVPGDTRDLAAVVTFPWDTVENPFSDNMAATLAKIADEIFDAPDDAAEKYAQVLSRGDQQRVFRLNVLRAYNYRCAICRTSFEEVLQSAHIVPWGDPRKTLRVDTRNGICLCANHHLLFDRGLISINEDYTIQYADPGLLSGPYTDADIALSKQYHGRSIDLPGELRNYPSPALLLERQNE